MPIPSFDKSESHSHSQLSLFPDACLVSRNSNCRIFRIKAFDKGNLIPKTENPIVGNEEIQERRSARSGAPRATNQALLQARPAREPSAGKISSSMKRRGGAFVTCIVIGTYKCDNRLFLNLRIFLSIRESFTKKKLLVLFGFCPNYLPPLSYHVWW